MRRLECNVKQSTNGTQRTFAVYDGALPIRGASTLSRILNRIQFL